MHGTDPQLDHQTTARGRLLSRHQQPRVALALPTKRVSCNPPSWLAEQDIESCMNMRAQLFRTDDRLARRQQASAELGVDLEALKGLPRAVRQAAASGDLYRQRLPLLGPNRAPNPCL